MREIYGQETLEYIAALFSFALFFLLPVAPCARTPHWLPAPARALLFSPGRLPIALCATKNIRKASGAGS